MLDLIIYFALGILLIYYAILISKKNNSNLLLMNNKFVKIYSIVCSGLAGLLSLITSFGTIYGESYFIYLLSKTYLLYVLMIFTIGIIIYSVSLKYKNNKYRFWNIKNIVLISLSILMILYLIISLSVPNISFNYKEEKIEISDIFYHKQFSLDEVEGIGRDDMVPDIDYNNKMLKVFNKYSLKGFFKDSEGTKYTILNNLRSETTFSFVVDGRRIVIGFLNKDDCDYLYELVRGKLEEKFNQ